MIDPTMFSAMFTLRELKAACGNFDDDTNHLESLLQSVEEKNQQLLSRASVLEKALFSSRAEFEELLTHPLVTRVEGDKCNY